MPELPEVVTLACTLTTILKGKKIYDLQFLSGKYKKQSPEGFKGFKKSLPLEVKHIHVKGKTLWITFKNCDYIIRQSFGLKGYWTSVKKKCHHNG